jgi:hypothetical protein
MTELQHLMKKQNLVIRDKYEFLNELYDTDSTDDVSALN